MPTDLAPTRAVSSHIAPLLGSVVDGYRLVEVLGNGGMGIVYRGERPEGISGAPSHVAIKVMQQAAQARFRARFRREVQVAMSLHHPHVLPMLGSGEIAGQPYVVFPLITGGTLAARLAQHHEALGLEEVGRYAEQLADALDYAHAHGVVHRDMKPSNVLLDERGDAYLADFGIARLFEGGVESLDQPNGTDVTTLTTTGEIIGTPAYMAPEQFQGQTVGPATDIYALGVVLYQLVTGRLPFTGETPIAVGLRHLHEAPLSPRILRPELPIPGAAAILRSLAKAPEQRFGSAGDLARAFAGGLQGSWVGQDPEQAIFYADGTAATRAGHAAPAVTATMTTQPAHPLTPPRRDRAFGDSLPQGNQRMGSIAGALLILGALVLALHGLTPTGSAGQRARVSTSTPTHAPVVASHFRYAGTSVFALDAGGATVWTTLVDAQVTSLTVANGRVYASTSSGAGYTLQASNGQILAIQAAQPSATPKHGTGKHGDGGGNGGDNNGD